MSKSSYRGWPSAVWQGAISSYQTAEDIDRKKKEIEERVKGLIANVEEEAESEVYEWKKDPFLGDRIKPLRELTGVVKSAPKPIRPALEAKLTKKIQELEQKLQRQNALKRNVDRRLREATKKLKQIEEAVQRARTEAVLNPVLAAPQHEVKV